MKSRFIVAIMVVLSFPATTWAGTLDRIRETGVFKLGYREDAAPFAFNNAIGEPSGYSVDLCRLVAGSVRTALGLEQLQVEYVPVNAKTRFQELESGNIDILCGPTSITLSRRERVDFSIPTFMDGASVLYTTEGPQNFEELAGKKIGVNGGTTTEEALRNTLQLLSLDAEVVAVNGHGNGLKALEEGSISAYFGDQGILLYLAARSTMPDKLKVSNRQFTNETYGLALQRGDPAFRLAVDRALSRIFRSGTIDQVFKNSFGPNVKPSDLTRAVFIIHGLPE